jgi:NAD(P)H-dependent flavin oxidoreductase YrpB (nitropropane dioxygenase family)
MTLDELADAIRKVKSATDRPFGVNIRADASDADDRVALLIREGVKVASFALAPRQELIARLKDAGAVVIPSVGAAKKSMERAGNPESCLTRVKRSSSVAATMRPFCRRAAPESW